MSFNEMKKSLKAIRTFSHYRLPHKSAPGGMGEVYTTRSSTLCGQTPASRILCAASVCHSELLRLLMSAVVWLLVGAQSAHEKEKAASRRSLSSWKQWLGGRDSNPDKQSQSLLSYR